MKQYSLSALDVPLAEDDEVIEKVAPDAAEKSLTNRIHERSLDCRPKNAHAGALCGTVEVGAELAVVVTDDELGRGAEGRGLPELLRRPLRRWVPSYPDMHDLSRHLGSTAASSVISVRSCGWKTGLFFTFLAATMSCCRRRTFATANSARERSRSVARPPTIEHGRGRSDSLRGGGESQPQFGDDTGEHETDLPRDQP